MKRVVIIAIVALALVIPPALAQNRPEKPSRDPYASRTYSPYSNASVRRERAARATARAIREDERRERSTSRRRYRSEVMDSIEESYDEE